MVRGRFENELRIRKSRWTHGAASPDRIRNSSGACRGRVANFAAIRGFSAGDFRPGTFELGRKSFDLKTTRLSLAGRPLSPRLSRREAIYAAAAVAAAAIAALVIVLPREDPLTSGHPIVAAGHRLVPVGFDDMPGFADDDLGPAFETLLRSCARIRADHPMAGACRAAEGRAGSDETAIRAYFTGNFSPYRIEPAAGDGLLTAYYEPVVPGSRTRTERFSTPLFPLPAGLVPVTDGNRPEGWDPDLTWGLETESGLRPFATRAEIDAGVLDGTVKPLAYVEDAVEAFYIHIQGSTRVLLPDGSLMRVGFAGKNGHPYSSVGKAMQDRGIEPEGGFSMDGMRAWFRDNPDRAAELMQVNSSYIFFREIEGLGAELGPIGGQGVPLAAGRSIAVDTAFHRYGTPVYIDARVQSGPRRTFEPFRRLMIAQDTGSAIKGPARADLFWGTGGKAGSTAGGIKAAGAFYVLLPNP